MSYEDRPTRVVLPSSLLDTDSTCLIRIASGTNTNARSVYPISMFSSWLEYLFIRK